jgi:hypothetical protein
LTRVMCEYWPSGFPSASGLSILMSGMVASLVAWMRVDHRKAGASVGARAGGG